MESGIKDFLVELKSDNFNVSDNVIFEYPVIVVIDFELNLQTGKFR